MRCTLQLRCVSKADRKFFERHGVPTKHGSSMELDELIQVRMDAPLLEFASKVGGKATER